MWNLAVLAVPWLRPRALSFKCQKMQIAAWLIERRTRVRVTNEGHACARNELDVLRSLTYQNRGGDLQVICYGIAIAKARHLTRLTRYPVSLSQECTLIAVRQLKLRTRNPRWNPHRDTERLLMQVIVNVPRNLLTVMNTYEGYGYGALPSPL